MNGNDRRGVGCSVRRLVGMLMFAAALSGLVALETPRIARAHDYSDCTPDSTYPCLIAAIWHEPEINFTFTASVPPNSPFPMRSRIMDGALNWPKGTSSRPNVTFDSTSLNWPVYPCDSYATGANGIHYYDLDWVGSGVVGWVCQFASAHRMLNAQVVFDNDRTWWPYNDLPPGTHLDLESVATHEFGHAFGWYGHFACSGSSIETMCAAISNGQAHPRSPEDHDRHTLTGGYFYLYPW